jgi:hypothetical protein
LLLLPLEAEQVANVLGGDDGEARGALAQVRDDRVGDNLGQARGHALARLDIHRRDLPRAGAGEGCQQRDGCDPQAS